MPFSLALSTNVRRMSAIPNLRFSVPIKIPESILAFVSQIKNRACHIATFFSRGFSKFRSCCFRLLHRRTAEVMPVFALFLLFLLYLLPKRLLKITRKQRERDEPRTSLEDEINEIIDVKDTQKTELIMRIEIDPKLNSQEKQALKEEMRVAASKILGFVKEKCT
ncbi:hypothetical protein [Candidatus Similichlamydia laticola]|uniref:Uncharacterized protein n=1 Tax=Candidatus Similichlamydia laticola TaxID=2170265 RepID=A0A369KAY7_9BACT|nr:hypothetical protein [Candidatus Similichlamydia laticola]RDB31771.1 hypothetical protein HAT2_00151 [Candidatus Similichlamydia laticola]